MNLLFNQLKEKLLIEYLDMLDPTLELGVYGEMEELVF